MNEDKLLKILTIALIIFIFWVIAIATVSVAHDIKMDNHQVEVKYETD